MRKRQEDRDLTGADGVILPVYQAATLNSGSREEPEAERGVVFSCLAGVFFALFA